MRRKTRMFMVACLLGASLVAMAAAAPLDLHDYWDQRCSACHGHAGAFARRWLAVEQGHLVGQHHRDNLAEFLRHHYLADDLVEPVMQMLAAQAAQAPTFQDRCAGCHKTAAEFARQSLDLRNGVLYGRHSGKPVRDYLATHGGLAPAQIPPMVDTLTRVRREVAPGP